MNKITNIGVVGSRKRNSSKDYILLYDKLEELRTIYKQIMIITGGAYEGADAMSKKIVEQGRKYDITIYNPHYDIYGVNATFERNTLIAKHSELLIAMVSSDRLGGTEDTLRKFIHFHPNSEYYLL